MYSMLRFIFIIAVLLCSGVWMLNHSYAFAASTESEEITEELDKGTRHFFLRSVVLSLERMARRAADVDLDSDEILVESSWSEILLKLPLDGLPREKRIYLSETKKIRAALNGEFLAHPEQKIESQQETIDELRERQRELDEKYPEAARIFAAQDRIIEQLLEELELAADLQKAIMPLAEDADSYTVRKQAASSLRGIARKIRVHIQKNSALQAELRSDLG